MGYSASSDSRRPDTAHRLDRYSSNPSAWREELPRSRYQFLPKLRQKFVYFCRDRIGRPYPVPSRQLDWRNPGFYGHDRTPVGSLNPVVSEIPLQTVHRTSRIRRFVSIAADRRSIRLCYNLSVPSGTERTDYRKTGWRSLRVGAPRRDVYRRPAARVSTFWLPLTRFSLRLRPFSALGAARSATQSV